MPSAENPWPDANCGQCDAVYREQGEWNEENEGRVRIKLLGHRSKWHGAESRPSSMRARLTSVSVFARVIALNRDAAHFLLAGRIDPKSRDSHITYGCQFRFIPLAVVGFASFNGHCSGADPCSVRSDGYVIVSIVMLCSVATITL